MGSYNVKSMVRDRSCMKITSILPIVLGVSIGFALSMVYIPIVEQFCLYDMVETTDFNYQNPTENKNSQKYENIARHPSDIPTTERIPTSIMPKKSQFNYDFRPYFIYSELGFRFKLLVAVLTTEDRLEDYAVAINNTWALELPKVIFFTPYSKNVNFHEKYNRQLNLNVVQLPDVGEDSTNVDLLFKMIQFLKDHYSSNYNLFMRVDDNAYINPQQLLQFINTLNSTEDLYIGYASRFKEKYTFEENSYWKDWTKDRYCFGSSGIIISRNLLIKIAANIGNCVGIFKGEDEHFVFESCVRKTIKMGCILQEEVQVLFQVDYEKEAFTESMIERKKELREAAVLYPVSTSDQILQIHKYFTLKNVKKTFARMRSLQTDIQRTVPSLPNDVPEKRLGWPIGFPDAFKPNSRFEVINWKYFNQTALFGQTDTSPVTLMKGADKTDLEEVQKTARSLLSKEFNHYYDDDDMILTTGYRRHDPKRGAEYILDFSMSRGKSKQQVTRRFHFLRPLTKIEALAVPPATEQRGIHLVLPVLSKEINLFERFLQMYKRVCLQTGENVVLLTVFINIRGNIEDDNPTKEDPFKEAKSIIARYKHSYMWAQLPWLQVGVKQPAPTLITDIVSMKLASNALIFLVNLHIEFTINFLNRCRVNAISGVQVFFPIPFAEYDPDLVYDGKQKPTFVDVYRSNGEWDRNTNDICCFSNKDYRDLRMHEETFLDENQSMNSYLIKVFQNSKLSIFRAVDSELRKRYTPLQCKDTKGNCSESSGEKKASKSQLARFLFKKEDFFII